MQNTRAITKDQIEGEMLDLSNDFHPDMPNLFDDVHPDMLDLTEEALEDALDVSGDSDVPAETGRLFDSDLLSHS